MEMPGPSKCKAIVDVFKEKFRLEEETDQSILDHHVNRIWSDSPPITPGSMSPRTGSNIRKKPLHIPVQHEMNNDYRYGDGACSSNSYQFFFYLIFKLIVFFFRWSHETLKINA